MKTLSQFAKEVLEKKDQPHALADLLLEMSAKFCLVSDTYKKLRIAKDVFWQVNKIMHEGKAPSDKELEIKWHATKEGERELRATIETKSLEKLMSSVKAYLRVLEVESRNQS